MRFPADPDELATCYAVRHVGGGAELRFAQSAPDWFVDVVGITAAYRTSRR